MSASDQAQALLNGSNSGQFDFINNIIHIAFNQYAWTKMSALLFSGNLTGIVILGLLFLALAILIYSFVMAIVMYLIVIVILSILIPITYFFTILVLFNKTIIGFKNLLFMMAAYAMMPVIAFTFLSIFSLVIFSFISTVLSFSACQSCILKIDFLFLDFCLFSYYKPWGSIDDFILVALSLVVCCYAMYLFIRTIPTLTSSIMRESAGNIVTDRDANRFGQDMRASGALTGQTAIGIGRAAMGDLKGASRNLGSVASQLGNMAANPNEGSSKANRVRPKPRTRR